MNALCVGGPAGGKIIRGVDLTRGCYEYPECREGEDEVYRHVYRWKIVEEIKKQYRWFGQRVMEGVRARVLVHESISREEPLSANAMHIALKRTGEWFSVSPPG